MLATAYFRKVGVPVRARWTYNSIRAGSVGGAPEPGGGLLGAPQMGADRRVIVEKKVRRDGVAIVGKKGIVGLLQELGGLGVSALGEPDKGQDFQ